MDQNSAQPSPLPEKYDIPPSSPAKKILPIIIISLAIILMFLGFMLMFAGKSTKNVSEVIPTPRPTATPWPAPTVPLVTQGPVNQITPTQIGRLSFIKDGDIYNSDFEAYSLLVKNAIPAGDRLTWSPKGRFLSWRPKSITATPSSVMVYDRRDKSYFTFQPTDKSGGELIDYVWSPDEDKIAIVYKEDKYQLSLYPVATPAAAPALKLINREQAINRVLWPKSETLIFSGIDGLNAVAAASSAAKLLVSDNHVLTVSLSPQRDKILYSVGDGKKSGLYILDLANNKIQTIPEVPDKLDMGESGLSKNIMGRGFIPYAIWFPKGDRLLVGYHYLTNFPFVGIYYLSDQSFRGIGPFTLYSRDTMIDDDHLLGERIKTERNDFVSWQVTLFTLEEGAALATTRVFPGVSSPAFFPNETGF